MKSFIPCLVKFVFLKFNFSSNILLMYSSRYTSRACIINTFILEMLFLLGEAHNPFKSSCGTLNRPQEELDSAHKQMTRNKLYKKTPKEFNTLIVFSIIIQKYYSKSGEKAEKCSRVLWLQLPSHTALTDRKKCSRNAYKGFSVYVCVCV